MCHVQVYNINFKLEEITESNGMVHKFTGMEVDEVSIFWGRASADPSIS